MRMPAKKLLITLLLVPGFLFFTGEGRLAGTGICSDGSEGMDQIVVYQFHRRFRCPSCHELEALIRKTLDVNYSRDLQSEKLVFRVVNLDEKSNKHFIKDYDLLYNTVIVVDRRQGREVRFKNLEKIWEFYEDEEKASEFLRSEIDEYLNDD